MGDFKRLILIPENTLNNLQAHESESKKVPVGIFDDNIDTKYMDDLKSGLISILNSSKIDSATIKKYKADLAMLMDLESPSEHRHIANRMDTTIDSTSRNQEDKGGVKMGEDSGDGYPGDDSTSELDFKSFNDVSVSESDFKESLSDGTGQSASTPFKESLFEPADQSTSTPKTPQNIDVDETLKSTTPPHKDIKKKLFQESFSLDQRLLKNGKKTTSRNAKIIEQFILKKGDGRIKENGANKFTIDGRQIRGNLTAAIIDLARPTVVKELKGGTSPGAKPGTKDLLRFLRDINIPEEYIHNIRRLGGQKRRIKTRRSSDPSQYRDAQQTDNYFKNYDPKL